MDRIKAACVGWVGRHTGWHAPCLIAIAAALGCGIVYLDFANWTWSLKEYAWIAAMTVGLSLCVFALMEMLFGISSVKWFAATSAMLNIAMAFVRICVLVSHLGVLDEVTQGTLFVCALLVVLRNALSFGMSVFVYAIRDRGKG